MSLPKTLLFMIIDIKKAVIWNIIKVAGILEEGVSDPMIVTILVLSSLGCYNEPMDQV